MSVLHLAETLLSLLTLAETCRGCYELISQACKRAEVVRSNERRRPFESACMASLLEKVATPATPAASCLLMPSSVATWPRNASAGLLARATRADVRACYASLVAVRRTWSYAITQSQCCIVHRLKKDESLREVSMTSSLFLICSGECRLVTRRGGSGGDGRVFNVLREGSCVGEVDFALGCSAGHYECVANVHSTVLEIPPVCMGTLATTVTSSKRQPAARAEREGGGGGDTEVSDPERQWGNKRGC